VAQRLNCWMSLYAACALIESFTYVLMDWCTLRRKGTPEEGTQEGI
jgi:hypothetical protein